MSTRTYEWRLGPLDSDPRHIIKIDHFGGRGTWSWRDVEPSCETCSIPFAIAEAVKLMNRFTLHTLVINHEHRLFWLV